MGACPVVDLDSALNISRDGSGMVAHVPRHRFVKTQFPAQEVKVLDRTIKFRVQKVNDPAQGYPVGIFETDDDKLAENLKAIIANSPRPLFIQYQNL